MDKTDNIAVSETLTDTNVIEAFENFVNNYDLLDVTFTYKGKDYPMSEMVQEMKNNTPVGKAYIQRIYYSSIVSFANYSE